MIRKVYQTPEEFFEQNKELSLNLPYSDDTSVLMEKITIGNKTIENRLCCQAMEGCDGTPGGSPDELTKRRYERFSKGGAGLIWFEATACQEDGRANPRQLWLKEENLDDFKRIVENMKETGLKENGFEPIIIMQNTHSGRYSKPHGTPAPLIAYNNPIFEGENPIDKSRILSDEALDKIGEAMVKNSALAEKAGFDGVDIKCCHRYLDSELLSAFERDGRYGGSLENRTRLLRESVKGSIEATSSDFIVSSRLNVYDGFPYPYGFGVSKDGGTDFDPTEPIWLINELYNMGVRVLNISMGNPYFNPHVNRPFAMGGYSPEEHPLVGVSRMLEGIKTLKKNIPDMKFISSGLSYLGVAAPNVCAAFIKDGGFDICGFGRQIFAYPEFAKDIKTCGELSKDKICIACSKCTEIMRSGGTTGCVIRDRDVYMPIYKEFVGGKK